MQPPVSQQFSATPFLLTLLISSNCFDVPRGARTLETCNFRQKCELAGLIRLMHECIQTPKCPEPQVLSRLVKGAPAEKINLVVGCDFFDVGQCRNCSAGTCTPRHAGDTCEPAFSRCLIQRRTNNVSRQQESSHICPRNKPWH